MKNDSNPIIRSEKVTIDMHICAALSESRSSGEIYFAAIAPDMELTVITLDEAPDILPCFDEDDAYLNIPDSSLLLSYNPAQVLKLAGKRYLTGPVILVRTNMDGEFISLTIDLEQNENTLTVLEIVPGQYPKQVEIDPDLKSLQQAVGGNIGASYPFSDPVAIVYNDEGKLMGLPLNRALRDESGEAYDVVAGTFLVVGLGEEDFASLTPELAQKYEEHFHQPEDFIRLGHRMMVVRVPDEAVCPEESKTTPPKDAGFDR